MTGNEFVRRLRKLARQRGVEVWIETRRGKGSHSRIFFGNAFTTLQDPKKELPRKTLRTMLQHLGVSEDEL